MSGLEVVDAGGLALLVGGDGTPEPADRRSHHVANLLAGNPAASGRGTALEVTAGPLEMAALGPVRIGLAGADLGARLLPDGRPVAPGSALVLRTGQRLRLDGLRGPGLRAYLAVHGGLVRPEGPRHLPGARPIALQPGTVLEAGPTDPAATAQVPARWSGPVTPDPVVLGAIRVVIGPHAHLLPAEALAKAWTTDWTVAPESDRQGLRLVERLAAGTAMGELPSLPVIPGVIQLPPDGRPIILGADAQPTGGYPVIATVALVDRSALGQLRPGDRFRLVPVAAETARQDAQRDRDDLQAAAAALLEAATWDELWHGSGA